MHAGDDACPQRRSNYLSPAPAKISGIALYLGATAAYLVAAGSFLLGVTYLLCTIPIEIPYLLPSLCNDTHYKYLVPILVPTTTWFAIANWVGWEYFRNA